MWLENPPKTLTVAVSALLVGTAVIVVGLNTLNLLFG